MYVQATPETQSRRLLRMDSGDALVHQYDLNHGVAVTDGTRHSLVVWISSTTDACHQQRSPWYEDDARRGDSDAQWNLGHLYKRGARGFPSDLEKAAYWYRQSAEQDHP